MTSTQAELDAYWNTVDQELASIPLDLSSERDEYYSQPEWSIFRLRYSSLAGYQLFSWLSVLTGSGGGPTAAVLRMPDYASVHDLIYTSLRHDAIVMNPTYRGQRNSDSAFQASYPGLLTEGIDRPESYVMRLVFADALRALDALLAQQEASVGPVALIGTGLGATLAVAVAAMRPSVRAVAADTPLILGHPRALEESVYPLAELTDYLRQNPHRGDHVTASTAPFDPVKIAAQVCPPVLLSLGRRDHGLCPLSVGEELAFQLPQCDLRVYDGASEGGGHEHGLVREQWLRQQLGLA